jgi:uncharacterized membrane protein YjdF
MLFIIIYSLAIKNYNYIFEAVFFIMTLLWFSAYYYKWDITKKGYTALACIMIMHSLGKFGAYNWHFIFDYDIYMHLASGIALALLIYPIIKPIKYTRGKIAQIAFTILIIIGLASVNEIIEFIGAIFIPHAQGMLAPEANPLSRMAGLSADYVDTMKDIIVTTCSGIITTILSQYLKKKKKTLQ